MDNKLFVPEGNKPYEGVRFRFDMQYSDLIDKQRAADKPDKRQLKKTPVYINIPGVPGPQRYYNSRGEILKSRFDTPELKPDQELSDGRYYTEIGTAHIEAFLKKGTRDYLYVFFDGSRSRNQGKELAPIPTFLRWTWYQYTSASVLCLEDPMFYTYERVKVGWFYGTEKEDYIDYCASLVKYIANKLNIPNSHIILYGPSGGGRVAVSMTRFIPESMAVSVNGQYDLKVYDYYKKGGFTEATNLRLEDDVLGRNDMASVIQNNVNNRYLLICNIKSSMDFRDQMPPLCKTLDITPEYGIKTFEHVTIWLFEAAGVPSTHSVWEDPLQFQMIDILLPNLINGAKAQDFTQFCNMINEYWYQRYETQKQIRSMGRLEFIYKCFMHVKNALLRLSPL